MIEDDLEENEDEAREDDEDDETPGLSEEDQELAEEMASGLYETSHGDDQLEVLLVYGDPTRYYCTLRRPEGPLLCAARPGIGGCTSADDGSGQDTLWLLAGAALPRKLAVAVVRAFERGDPPVLPFVPGHIYNEGQFFSDWSGPRPLRRESGALAVELDDVPTTEPASSGVWQALTHVTVTTPEVLAFLTAHPLPSLRRLRTWPLDLTGQGAALQAALDAHPHMTALEIDANQLDGLPPLSAPHLQRLIIEYDAPLDEQDAVEQTATSTVSRWRLAGHVEIVMGFVGMLALDDPDFADDTL